MTDQPTVAPQPVHGGQHTFFPPDNTAHEPLTDAVAPGLGWSTRSPRFAGPFVQLDRGGRRIAAYGELDIAAVPMLADALAMMPDTEPGDITLDLTGVSFIDASALGYLAGLADKLEAHGARLSVEGASAWLQRVFDIVQLGGLLTQTHGQ